MGPPRRRHVAITAGAVSAVGLLATGRPGLAGAVATGSIVGVAEFAAARIAPGPRSPDEFARMAVTSALIGPRTLQHLESQLAAADTTLPADILDAIDAIVAPGIDLAPQEKIAVTPALTDPALRRRS